MAREFAKKFYNSKQWIKCRNAYRETKFHICERCGQPGEEVHHKKHLNPSNINDPDITLSWDNLELLCQSCHSKEHATKHGVVREDVTFNSNGDLIRMCEDHYDCDDRLDYIEDLEEAVQDLMIELYTYLQDMGIDAESNETYVKYTNKFSCIDEEEI